MLGSDAIKHGNYFFQGQIKTQLRRLKSEQEELLSSVKDRECKIQDYTVGTRQLSLAEGGGWRGKEGTSPLPLTRGWMMLKRG